MNDVPRILNVIEQGDLKSADQLGKNGDEK